MAGNTIESIIGAIVLLVAGGFLAFAYSSTDIGTVDGYVLNARFDSIDGLNVGDDVRMSGIKVGSIIAQKLDTETFEAVVTLSVRPSVRLPDDTSAKITSDGLLGGHYLSIEPGGDEEFLAPGDRIQYTQGSVDLMGLIGKAVVSVGGGDKKKE